MDSVSHLFGEIPDLGFLIPNMIFQRGEK